MAQVEHARKTAPRACYVAKSLRIAENLPTSDSLTSRSRFWLLATMNYEEREEIVALSATMANRAILDDRSWQLFGYKKRPVYGSLISRWFRARWRVELEDRLMQEILVTNIASHIICKILPANLLRAVVDHYKEFEGYYEAFGYRTPAEGGRAIQSSVELYVNTLVSDWGKLLVQRLELNKVPHKGTVGQLLAGAAKMVVAMQSHCSSLNRVRGD